MNEQKIIEKPWRGIAVYQDYKDTDSIRIAQMKGAIRGVGGDVICTRTTTERYLTEYFGRASIAFAIPDDGYSGDTVKSIAKQTGWEVRWL